MKAGRWTQPLTEWDMSVIDDDFLEDIATARWTKTTTDSGTIDVGDGRKGIATFLPSDGSVGDNDEVYLACVNEVFLIAGNPGKPIYGRGLIQFTEGNTDDLNVCFGFANAIAADWLIDDGGGMRASGTQAAIYKIDGGTVWRCYSRNGTETTDTVSTTTAGGSAYQTLEILIHDYTRTSCQIAYKVDGAFLKDTNGATIKHTLLVASAGEMQFGMGAKNGGAGTVETLLADRLYAHQLR